MSKYYYSDYVEHCLRFYTRYKNPNFYSDVDKQDWTACDNVIKTLSIHDRNAIYASYGSKDTIADNVYEYCKRNNIEQSYIWFLIAKVELMIAKQRGIYNDTKLRQYPKRTKET